VCACAGIADGVGSWREHGVDPRAYSHRLMELADEFVQTMVSPPQDAHTHAHMHVRTFMIDS
jgi:hypothetical protein